MGFLRNFFKREEEVINFGSFMLQMGELSYAPSTSKAKRLLNTKVCCPVCKNISIAKDFADPRGGVVCPKCRNFLGAVQ